MPIKLSGIVDVSMHCGQSKSGLDWSEDKKDNPDTQTENKTEEQTDLVETSVGPEGPDVDNRPLKSYIMSIHKNAAELYNTLEDADDPEEWVMEKAKAAASLLNSIHGHVLYAKNRVEELDMEVRDAVDDQGW